MMMAPRHPDSTDEHPIKMPLDWRQIILIAFVLGASQFQLHQQGQEIEKLRTANEERARSDLQSAGTVATKQDVQRLSDKLDEKFERLQTQIIMGRGK